MSTIMARHPLTSLLCVLGLLVSSTAVLPGQALKASSQKPAAVAAHVPVSLPAKVIQESTSFLGVPYVHAGDSRAGMDCSGFVYRVFFDTTGARLPRGVGSLDRFSVPARYPLHIGDLLFFDTRQKIPPSVPTHVGVYIGRGRVVHAASEGSKTGVIVSSMGDPYYHDRLLGARRILPWRAPMLDVTLIDETSRTTEVEPFASNSVVTLRVFNRMTGGGPVSLTVLKDGRQVLSRWITVGAARPAEVAFTAEVGQWSVRISRIFKGRVLSDLSFAVVE